MSGATHLRYEILRALRNPMLYAITLGLPLVLFYGVASGQRHVIHDGTTFPLYFMTAMAVYGAMFAVTAPGARIARDRASGWTRQMMVTPLRARTEVIAKVVTMYLLALLSLALLFLAGASLGVRLSATQWLELAGLLLVGVAPLAVLALILGYLLPSDALAPAVGGVVILLALFGGVYGFQLASSGPLFEVMKGLPSYWLVLAGDATVNRGNWPAQAWITIAVWVVVLVPVAMLAFRRSGRRV
jgi:ABC-2 type transport system permease protein